MKIFGRARGSGFEPDSCSQSNERNRDISNQSATNKRQRKA